jgi:CheY-like chemotaxis protein
VVFIPSKQIAINRSYSINFVMHKIMVCDVDDINLESCCLALRSYNVKTASSMKDCLEAYRHDDEKPELLLSAYQLKDGNAGQVIRAMSEMGFIKSIIMTTADMGRDVLEPLYQDNLLHATITKPMRHNVLGELVARTLERCPICLGSKHGNARDSHCEFCRGSGRFTKNAYAFFLHHDCDCKWSNGICDWCHHKCHHLN